MLWNWIKSIARNNSQLRLAKYARLQLECLEVRETPVVGAVAVDDAPLTARGSGYDGVVNLNDNSATGALLFTGRHILTAAHITGGTGNVKFELLRGGANVDVVIKAGTKTSNPGYVNTDSGNDIAVWNLTDPITPAKDRFLIAPFGADKYSLYDGRDEVGQEFVFSGYGYPGTGLTGENTKVAPTPKRTGENTFDLDGSQQIYEIQAIKLAGVPTKGNFVLQHSATSTTIPWDADAAKIQAALWVSLDGAKNKPLHNNVLVRGGLDVGGNRYFFIEFTGKLGPAGDVYHAANFVVPAGLNTLVDAKGGVVAVTETERQQGGKLQAGSGSKNQGGTKQLTLDFDSGLAQNDVIGLFYGQGNKGLGRREAINAQGDSGGPSFLKGSKAIAAVTSWRGYDAANNAVPDVDASPANSSFGEYAGFTRVSSYTKNDPANKRDNWLNETLSAELVPGAAANAGQYNIVLDMNYQVLGKSKAGEDVKAITAKMNGTRLQLWVDINGDGKYDQPYEGMYFSEEASKIISLTIRGSDDNETFIIDGPLALGGTDTFGKNAKIVLAGGGGNDTFIIGGKTTGLWDGYKIPISIDGGPGDDVIEVNDIASVSNNKYTLTKNTLTRDAFQVTYKDAVKFTLNTGAANDDVTVASTSADVTQGYFVNTLAGKDTVTVGSAAGGLNEIKGKVYVDGGVAGGAPWDTLVIEDRASTVGRTYQFTVGALGYKGTIQRDATAAILYYGMEYIHLQAGSAADVVNVDDLGDANAYVYLNTRGGNDKITVGTAADGLAKIKSRVYINNEGAAGNDELTVNDTATLAGQKINYEIKPWTAEAGWSGTVKRSDLAMDIVHYKVSKITLNTGAADDTITVSETHAHVTQGTFINAGAGDDTFIIGSAANGLDNIATFVTLDGQAGTNTLRVDDTKGKAGKGAYKINKAKAAGEGNLRKIAAPGTPFIEFKNITTAPVPNGKSLTFLGRETGSEIQLAGLWAGMSFEYVGNVGADKLTLASDTSILDDVLASISFLGDGGTDTLVVQDGNYGAGERYSINKDTLSIARSSFLNLAWSNVEEMFLTSGPGSDRISLSDLTPTLNLHLDGGSAVDDRVVIAQGVVSTPQVSFANIETLEITNGTLDLGSSVAFLRYEQSGGVLKGSATLTVQNQGDWTGGASTGLGTSVFAAGSTLTITSPATKTLDDRTVELYGTTTWDQGPIAPDSSGGPGTLHNEPGATFSGTGVFTGNFINDGTLQPGSAAATGVVAVHGDFAQTGTGLLSIGLGGPGGSDQLVVAGHVAIAGALGVTLLPGFNPSVGASFTVLDNQGLDPVSGTFAGLPQGATLSVAGWLLQLSYTGGTGNDVTLTVLATAPITLALSSNPSFYGQPVTLTATLAANASVPPTGTVSFYDGTVLLGSGPVTQGPLGSTASFVTSTLSLGNLSISATYGGDSNYPSSTSAALIETVQKDASTVGLSADHSTSVVGQTVNFTATVTPASYGANPSGTVSFYDGSSLLGTVPLSQGMLGSQATFSTSALSLGNHSIKAVYNGDSYFTASTSWLLTETVQQATTSTYLSASSNPSYGGQAVTFTASISSIYMGTPPTGTVSFFDGTTLLGTGTLGAGGMGAQATFITSTLALGSHSITAVYGGDATYLTSTSSAVTETVQQPTTSTTLSESISSSYPGQAVTFTASVSSMGGGGTPTGTVSFFDGTTLLGTGTLGAGGMGAQATFITSTLALGSHSITAAYGGDSTYASATSSALTESVSQPMASVGLSSSTPTSSFGQAVTFTATVSPPPSGATPTGSVTFYDGTAALGTVTLSTGMGGTQAAFTTSTLGVGSHSITAVYGGDATYAGGTSPAVTETVQQASTATTSTSLSSSAQTAFAGQAVTFTATVTRSGTGATPTGTLTFYDGNVSIGSAAVSPYMGMGGQAVLTLTTLAVGSHSITAVYSGDGTCAGSTSTALSETVQRASVMEMISTSNSSAMYGQAVTFTATVYPNAQGVAPTGTISFYDGSTLLATISLSQVGGNYQAAFTTSTLSRGSHTIVAVYSGDQDFTGNSASVGETIS